MPLSSLHIRWRPLAAAVVAIASLSEAGCSGGSSDGAADTSADVVAETDVRTPSALQALVDRARADVYPELASFRIQLVPMSSATDYFRSDVTTDTALNAAPQRTYSLHYNTRLLDDPPSPAAVTAILIHELKHIRDYTRMSSIDLIAFAIRYSTQDTRAYEHQTDEYVLQHRWGPALKLYRLWLYAHEDDAGRQEKMRIYYTPDEIDAYIAAHPELR
jgi:hypothetical protein